jgi:hypothetical protein
VQMLYARETTEKKDEPPPPPKIWTPGS